MKYLKVKLLILPLILTLPSYVSANTRSEEINNKVFSGIDKAGEMASLGIEKLFLPLHKGVEKLVKPRVDKINAEYYYNLGIAYYQGDVSFNSQYIKKNDLQALEALTNSAYLGHKLAPYKLGVMYYKGEGTPVNRKKACEWFLRGALISDTAAQANVGACYYTGEGFQQDLAEAFRWFSLAASDGNKSAQYLLAEMYADGQGTELNLTLAKEWYEKSAAQGHQDAQKKLNKLKSSWDTPYQQLTVKDMAGKVIDGDAYFVSAANSAQTGNAKAQFDLGVMYFRGIGVPQDYHKALVFFEKANDLGHERAKDYIPKIYFELGSNYFGEDALEYEDAQEAFKWFSKAAELGHAESQYIIGLMYFSGEGTQRNESKGIQLIQQSAQNGFEEAKK